jgi:hypothetical protein
MRLTFSGNGIGFGASGMFFGSGELLWELLTRLLAEGEDGSSEALRLASVSGQRVLPSICCAVANILSSLIGPILLSKYEILEGRHRHLIHM